MFFRKDPLERWVEGDPRASPHLAIVGRTGAGKTTLAKKIALSLLLSRQSITVLDFDGEYSELPLPSQIPPFPLPQGVSLAWLISQVARPLREEGGGFGIAGLLGLLEEDTIDEMISRLRHDFSIPYNVRFAVLWRLLILKKYFTTSYDDPGPARWELSRVGDVRERQVCEQIIASFIVSRSPKTFLLIEEGVPGEWLADLLALARRRQIRLVYVSQRLPESLHNFELILFTPYISNPRPLPLPVNPALDRGVWWVGGLGVHRIKLPR